MEILDRRELGARALERVGSGTAATLLSPLAAAYAVGLAAHRRLFRPRPLPPQPPSLAIGNLRVGGTGKTPVVADLGRRFAASGRAVAVLMRGFRAEAGADEPAWLREQGLRVELGADRRSSFERARAAGAELVLLDDALQSRVLASSSAAILLEEDFSQMPRLLPAGPLREGVGALARVDFIFARCEGADWPELPARFRSTPVYAFRLRSDCLASTSGADAPPLEPCFLLSGLARPESFERDAQRFGLRPVASLRLRDHAALGGSERQLLAEFVRARRPASVVLPAKNAVRFSAYLRELGLGVFVLHARVEWREDPLEPIRERLKL